MSSQGLSGSSRASFFQNLITLVGIALLLLMLAYILVWSPNFDTPVPGGDYVHFYLAARIFREGAADHLYDFAYQIQLQHDPDRMPFPPLNDATALYIYPPFVVWFCLPFSYLSFRAGATAWVLFMSLCLVASLWILRTSLKARDVFSWALLASIPFVPALMAIYSCQNSTLSLLILTATYALLRGGYPLAAGLVFALQAFKPQFALVIALTMLLKRQWRFIAGGVIGGLIWVAASLALSPSASIEYLRLASTLAKWTDLPGISLSDVANWRGFWRLLLGDDQLSLARKAAVACSLVSLMSTRNSGLGGTKRQRPIWTMPSAWNHIISIYYRYVLHPKVVGEIRPANDSTRYFCISRGVTRVPRHQKSSQRTEMGCS